eukprot:5058163-Amphidinium_carterae.1
MDAAHEVTAVPACQPVAADALLCGARTPEENQVLKLLGYPVGSGHLSAGAGQLVENPKSVPD